MKKFTLYLVALIALTMSCNKEPGVENPQGKNLLLIGNSFFRPYAEKLDDITDATDFENHNSTIVMRGGNNGRAINFWRDSTTAEHMAIKAALDQGNIDVFGMTSGHDTNNYTEGFSAWIAYALQNNPDVTVFISISTIDYPDYWDTTASHYGFNTIEELYDYYVNDRIHKNIVDSLRVEFPNTTIFTVPTGWATFQLNQMWEDSLLLDNINRMGSRATSIFTDTKGHQGDIVRETGGLIWMNSIYNYDLSTSTYNTGFNTDLHDVALQIMNNHDSNYKQ